jgi:hypothetical protein
MSFYYDLSDFFGLTSKKIALQILFIRGNSNNFPLCFLLLFMQPQQDIYNPPTIPIIHIILAFVFLLPFAHLTIPHFDKECLSAGKLATFAKITIYKILHLIISQTFLRA